MASLGYHFRNSPFRVITRSEDYLEVETENGRMFILLLFILYFLFLGTLMDKPLTRPLALIGLASFIVGCCTYMGFSKRFSFDLKASTVSREIRIFGQTWSVKEYPMANIQNLEVVYRYTRSGSRYWLSLNANEYDSTIIAIRTRAGAIRDILNHIRHYISPHIEIKLCGEYSDNKESI